MKPIYFFSIAIGFLLFISVLSSLVIGKYLGNRRDNGTAKKIFVINMIALGCLMAYKLSGVSYVLAEFLVRFGVIWFVVISIATALSLIVLIISLFWTKAIGKDTAPDPGRRNFLRQLVFLPAVGAGIYGGLYEPTQIEYNEVKIPVTVQKLKDVVMAQVSDVHLGLFFSVEKLQKVLMGCLLRKANMLVLTGDIFDSNSMNEEAIAAINKFVPYFPYGVYFCWGNHEHMRDMTAIKNALAKTDIKVLTNDSIKLFSGSEPVYILGVDYVESREEYSSKRTAYLQQALSQVPANSYKILLAHHPNFIDDGFREGIDLILTGHTHGGQVMIFNTPVLPIFKHMAGPVRQGNQVGYVSRGTGSWFPFRLGCPPEVVIYKFV